MASWNRIQFSLEPHYSDLQRMKMRVEQCPQLGFRKNACVKSISRIQVNLLKRLTQELSQKDASYEPAMHIEHKTATIIHHHHEPSAGFQNAANFAHALFCRATMVNDSPCPDNIK